jgi:FtsH-binding integral membrane protein
MLHPVTPAPLLASPSITAQSRIELARTIARYGGTAAAVTAAWAAAIWTTQHVTSDPLLRDCALFVHLASLTVGMGAVLTLDWFAARWLLGHHDRADLLRLVGGTHTLIWAGFSGLTLSGVFLAPDLSNGWTQVKLLTVLVVALNGLHAHHLQRQLETTATLGWLLMARAGAVATISQVGWWTAVVVGFLNAR